MTDSQQHPAAVVGGHTLRRGSRVRLRPSQRADIFDLALRDHSAIVDAVEEDLDGRVHVAVTLEADPGRDLSARVGQRFFFAVDEVELLEPEHGSRPRRVLVAGIGNVFLGDDGFGVEVVRRLGEHPRRPGVDVVDFGIRGMDLVYALGNGYHAVVLVDAAPRNAAPGTVSLVEPELDEMPASPDPHRMDPVSVLRQARECGPLPERILLVACEPATQIRGDDPRLIMELSAPVRDGVDRAVRLLDSLLAELTDGQNQRGDQG